MSESDTAGTFQTTPSRDTILQVENANVTFEMDRGVSNVLDDVSLEIEREEILGVVGESGSGKSMFASALLDAVVEPGRLSGEITYYPDSGEPVDLLELSDSELKQTRWEDISMVFQGAMSSFNPTSTMRQHFVETLRAHNRDVDEGLERAHMLLSDLYLEPERALDAYPHELSGGMKQRVLIALSLLLDPEVLVMDEPTASLDLLMQRSIIQLLEKLKDRYDLTLVFITHDIALLGDLADRLAVMYAFDFVEIGATDEVIERANHPYTRALLKSVPNLEAPVEKMRPIEGSSPDPVNVPTGCSYHPRCPIAEDKCRAEDPPMRETENGRRTACFYPDTAIEEIDIALEHETEAAITSQEYQPSDPVVTMDDVEVHFNTDEGLFGMFGSSETVYAVDGVSLDIGEKEVISLVGESGSGKTTLGKTAVGLQRPTGGSVKYRGQDVFAAKDGSGTVEIPYDDIRKSLQIIHQDPGSSLNPNRRVKKILSEPLKRWYDLDGESRIERIYQMLSILDMTPPDDYAERFPHQLSGGEQQRIALIRAILTNPDLILADEAVSALDVSLRIEMMDLFLEMQEQFDTSFLFISHDLSNARYITEKANGRVGIMYLGKLVEVGTLDEILNESVHPYTEALVWATPQLREDDKRGEMPLREIDIPDPSDPPSGCPFHTRCPEARDVCQTEVPPMYELDESHQAACFRAIDDHEYWSSEPLADTDSGAIGGADR